METDDSLNLWDSSNSAHGSEIGDPCDSASEVIKSDSQPQISQVIDEAPETMLDELHESMDTSLKTEFGKQALPLSIEFKESEYTENGSLSIQSKSGTGSCEEDRTFMGNRQTDASLSHGIKRPRMTVDEHQHSSVHVVYYSLPSESKQKLEKLLQQWSQWHSRSCSSSDDLNATLESGEKTYFPALRIGSDKPSDVTFWVDNQTNTQSDKEHIPLDGTSIPLYDRGYSLALTSSDGSCKMDRGVEKLDSSRCFNCGSYSHALKDCPKPRDNAAVNSARKQHKARRNQHVNSRNSTRYYEGSRRGKYDSLVPGRLDADTRRALGLGELDPPPWLNRMREIGYPLGYLDQDVDAQPSGITIFGGTENEKEIEQVEILDTTFTDPSRKMTVEFPGVNAPIPENADERLWAPASSRPRQSRDTSHRRAYNHSSEKLSRWPSTERRRFRDLEDDGPPGCDFRDSPSLSNNFRRYGDYDFSDYPLSPRASPPVRWSSSYGRTYSDNGRRSPQVHDGFSPSTLDYISRDGDYDYGNSFSTRDSPSNALGYSYGRYYSDRGRRSPLFHEGSPKDGWYGSFPYSSPR